MIKTTITKRPPRMNKLLNPRNPIIKPETKEPSATPRGEKIVSITLVSSGYFFNFWDNNPLRPEPHIKPDKPCPSLIKNMMKKLPSPPKIPSAIENPLVRKAP